MVALDDFEARRDAELADAEQALENQTSRANFLEGIGYELAQSAAPALLDKAIKGIVGRLKTRSAHGIVSEAASEWEEAAHILQANGHLLAEMLRSEIRGSVTVALKQMSRADRLSLWLAEMDLNECFTDFTWPDPEAAFEPLAHWSGTLDETENEIVQWILSALHAHELAV